MQKLSPATLSKLAKLGIRQRADLLLHLPLRYEDETRLTPIVELQPGETAQVEGEITSCEVAYRPRRTLMCRLRDDAGELVLRFLNFYPSQQKQLAVGKRIRALGEARLGYFGLEMVHPKCRAVEADAPLNAGLTPVYPATAGLSQILLRKLIAGALQSVPLDDTLPQTLREKLYLPAFAEAVRFLHNPLPETVPEALETRSHPAWQRIKFDELLAQQLSMRLHHRERGRRQAPSLGASTTLAAQLLAALPFGLTRAQQKVLAEIRADLLKPHPMQRLLLGDVGSGKTIVAALAALQAIESGYQVALMAPTEILAEQHFLKLRDWLTPLGITPVWLTGSLKKKTRLAAIERIAAGETLLAIGTHALFQAQVEFDRLGLVIVDEQHKFGVHQRLALRNKGMPHGTAPESSRAPQYARSRATSDETYREDRREASDNEVAAETFLQVSRSQHATKQIEGAVDYGVVPHQLMMSATPIPRTLAMSYYADLDVSVIDELPPGRTPVVTKLVGDARREEVFERVRAACLEGRQAYWVCPLIDESEALQLQTALDTFATLSAAFPELRIGLVHGKLANEEKAAVMAAFKAGELQLLVATTVIEVGVDVPNASLMIIDHAERMGLAQLHQLRGRVGRGAAESACVLLYQAPLSELARARLKVIYENTDGFEIARQDLQLRGPGELLGARQSGVAMLRFADIEADEKLLEQARQISDTLLIETPEIAQAHLRRWMPHTHDYWQV